MTDSSQPTENNRPFLLSILCIAIFVYAGFLAFLFLLSVIFNGWITATLIDFFPEKTFSGRFILLISLIGLILNTVSVIGVYYLWKLRKAGFFLYLISNLIFIFLPFVVGYGNLYSSAILILILLLISIYYRKLK
jgi:hypothetical protein